MGFWIYHQVKSGGKRYDFKLYLDYLSVNCYRYWVFHLCYNCKWLQSAICLRKILGSLNKILNEVSIILNFTRRMMLTSYKKHSQFELDNLLVVSSKHSISTIRASFFRCKKDVWHIFTYSENSFDICDFFKDTSKIWGFYISQFDDVH